MSQPIRQEIDFTASPQQVYEALTDSKQFTAFSDFLLRSNRKSVLHPSASLHKSPDG